MALTLGEINKKIPDGVQELGTRKGFALGIGYKGGDWVQDGGARKVGLKFDFYFPNGFKRQCDIGLPNKLFQYTYFKLDDIANIPALKISEENVIKLRVMYMIGVAHHGIATTPEFNPQKSAKYLTSAIAISINDFGEITERKWSL